MPLLLWLNISMKVIRKLVIFAMFLVVFLPMNCVARQVIIETHMENAIMVDVARRYYSVDEIKQYIDALAEHDNGTLQIHFTDDENVGIECNFLDQSRRTDYIAQFAGVCS